jgi:uncharacterized protein HemX
MLAAPCAAIMPCAGTEARAETLERQLAAARQEIAAQQRKIDDLQQEVWYARQHQWQGQQAEEWVMAHSRPLQEDAGLGFNFSAA